MKPIILYKNELKDASSINISGYSGDLGIIKPLLTDERPYVQWTSSQVGDLSFTINFPSAKAIDSIGLSGHNLKGDTITFSAGGGASKTITVENDNSIILRVGNLTTATQVTLSVNVLDNAKQVKIGSMFVGKALEFPVHPVTPYVPYQESIKADKNVSKTGNLLGVNVKYNPIRLSASFQYLPRNDNEFWTDYNTFWNEYGKKLKHFFYAWDLEYAPQDTFYVRFTSDMAYSTPLSIASYVDSLTLSMEGLK